jgi:hypothetical protein
MAKREYTPLLSEGFKEIGRWELDKMFLEPFYNNEQRKKLIDKLQLYLDELLAVGLDAEVWIDGSFTTEKPEPEDVDIVILFNRSEVESLTGRKAELFESIVMDRDIVKANYGVDVHFMDKDDQIDRNTWIQTFGFDSRKISTKGIFKVIINPNV